MPTENTTTVADRTSLFGEMDVDATNMSAVAASGLDLRSPASDGLSRPGATATQQSKRQVTADSDVTEDGNERTSKRLRQNSTNTESSSSSFPANRSPLLASYCSMQRYRTQVTDCCMFLLLVDLNKTDLYVCPYVRPSVHPQKVSPIRMKFGVYVEVDE